MGANEHEPRSAVTFEAEELMDSPETRAGQLSLPRARALDWQASRLIPELLEALTQLKRPILYEIACGPNSILSGKMKQLTKQEESARRFAFWNGYDVSSSQGVRAIIASLDKERPEHVWLSLECGPFSKMQQVNQHPEKQRQELKRHVNHVSSLMLGDF